MSFKIESQDGRPVQVPTADRGKSQDYTVLPSVLAKDKVLPPLTDSDTPSLTTLLSLTKYLAPAVALRLAVPVRVHIRKVTYVESEGNIWVWQGGQNPSSLCLGIFLVVKESLLVLLLFSSQFSSASDIILLRFQQVSATRKDTQPCVWDWWGLW